MKRSITIKQGKKGATITATGSAAADLLRGLCSAYGLESPFVNDRKPAAPEATSAEGEK
jgi:hypothetical protein